MRFLMLTCFIPLFCLNGEESADFPFAIELTDGKEMAAAICNETITLNDGKNDFSIHPSEIVSLSVHGGIWGTLKEPSGNAKSLSLSFAKEPHVTLAVAPTGEKREVAWNEMCHIHLKSTTENPAHFSEKTALDIPQGISFDREEVASENSKSLDPQENLSALQTQDAASQTPQGISENPKSQTQENASAHETQEAVIQETPQKPHTPLLTKKVTNKEYLAFVKAIGYPFPTHWMNGQIPQGFEDKPVVNITYKDAFLYSVWAGKRLPNTDELNQAFSQGLLEDGDDSLCEWTASPQLHREETEGKPLLLKHKVFTKNLKPDFALSNDECNQDVGFRCAERN